MRIWHRTYTNDMGAYLRPAVSKRRCSAWPGRTRCWPAAPTSTRRGSAGRSTRTCSTSAESPSCAASSADRRAGAGRHHDLERADRGRPAAAVRRPEAGRAAKSAAGRSRTPARSPAISATPRRRPTACPACWRSMPRSRSPAGRRPRACRSRQFITGVRRTALAPGELVSPSMCRGPRHDGAQRLPQARRAALSGDLHRHGGRDRGDRRRPRRRGAHRGRRLLAGGRSGCPRSKRRSSARRSTRASPIGSRPRIWRRCRRSTMCAAARPIAATRVRAPCCAACCRASRHEGAPFTLNGQAAAWRRSAGHAAGRRRCATISVSPAPRSAATPATAAPARCCSTAAGLRLPGADGPGRRSPGRDGRGPGDGDGALAALQQSFLAHGAAQCGICTPGMLMAAEELLARHADARAAPRSRTRWAACSAAAPATARSSRP